MAYVPICTSGTAEWRGMNRRKGVELKKGMEEMPLLYTLYSVEFQRHVAFLFARTVGVQKGLEHKHSRVKTDFQCTHTMGGPAPSLHRESTDSLILSELITTCLSG